MHRVNVDFEHREIDVNHVKTMNQCSPLDNLSALPGGSLPSLAQLSIFEFVPPGPKSGTRELTSPFLLASFSYPLDNFDSGSPQTTQTTFLCKWVLQNSTPKLHASLVAVSSKKNSASSVTDLAVSRKSLYPRSTNLIRGGRQNVA